MHDYVRRLVTRLSETDRPLSRNKHFHTFDTPLGRRALKLSRQLRSLAQDIVAQAGQGGALQLERQTEPDGKVRILLHLSRLKAKRTAFLSEGEWELLLQERGVRETLERAGVAVEGASASPAPR